MKNNLQFSKAVAALAFTLFSFGTLSAKDWFVKPGASGTGADWSTAANITIISNASVLDGDVIHLAAGSYLRTTQLTISKYITIMGGYPVSPTGTDIVTRDVVSNQAIFSPDPATSPNNTKAFSINATTVAGPYTIIVDGIYIEGFNTAAAGSGGALSITGALSDITFKNVSFLNNIANAGNGGVLYMNNTTETFNITFDGCTFTNNQASIGTSIGYGGVFFINSNGATSPKTFTIKNCLFKGNTAGLRGGVAVFSNYNTVNITDCEFDSNQALGTTFGDNTSYGGCFYLSDNNTMNITRCLFVNSLASAKGGVIWGNSFPNQFNLTNCSLIGNYSTRTSSSRAALDADDFNKNVYVLNGCVLSNYNSNSSSAKQSNKADVMNLGATTATKLATFTNSILNGVYFASSNTYDAVTPTALYATKGYLADSTINQALSGDLKISDKIVYKKTFTAANVGSYTHAQIFDIKQKLFLPMQLLATIPVGFTLTVDGTDYIGSGSPASIIIAASLSTPVMALKTNTAVASVNSIQALATAENGNIYISGIEAGYKVSAFNLAGQQLLNQTSASDHLSFAAKGFVLVKVSANGTTRSFKLLSE